MENTADATRQAPKKKWQTPTVELLATGYIEGGGAFNSAQEVHHGLHHTVKNAFFTYNNKTTNQYNNYVS